MIHNRTFTHNRSVLLLTALAAIAVLVGAAVSDLLDEDLPFDFNLWLSPTGWARGTLTCLARPSSLIALNRFRAQTALASERMTRFWGRFLDDLE